MLGTAMGLEPRHCKPLIQIALNQNRTLLSWAHLHKPITVSLRLFPLLRPLYLSPTMPELPEVETTRRILEPLLLGRRIQKLVHSDPARYRRTELAEGCKVLGTSRRGKYLILHLDQRLEAIVHLGMTGGFRIEPHRHTRVTLHLAGHLLYYTDPRRFGKWWVVEAGDYGEIDLLKRMGPEPLSEGFSLASFQSSLLQTSRKIKEVLLGQEAVAGVGNIYADESLWMSKIHPERPAQSLRTAEIKKLYGAIREVLERAVGAGGSTLSDKSYQQPGGEPGYFQLHHNAYARTGQRCNHKSCKGSIVKIVVGGRGTHFCPLCQRKYASPFPKSTVESRAKCGQGI